MAKGKQKTKPTETPEAAPETEASTSEETALDKPKTNAIASIGHGDTLFLSRYKDTVERVSTELPTPNMFQEIIDNLPEEHIDNLMGIIQKTMGARKGIYGDSDRPDFPELRIYHGTGNDPNRPEKQVPGEYYLTTKENVGDVFEGTVLALWEGRTMWGDAEAGETTKMPICQSMDRRMGSTCGVCDDCPHRPWRDNKQQRCADDVVAFMLTKDMKEIVLVRFQKTSEPAGKQLRKFVKRSMLPWSKWFQITSESRTSKHDTNRRWFVMKVEPSQGDDALVPETIHAFCDAMCSTLEATFILPNMSSIYRSGQTDEDDQDETEGTAGGSAGMMDGPKAEGDYGDMEDAPEEPNV